jgi:hypothetical protein
MDKVLSSRILILATVVYGATIGILGAFGADNIGIIATIGAAILGVGWVARGLFTKRTP